MIGSTNLLFADNRILVAPEQNEIQHACLNQQIRYLFIMRSEQGTISKKDKDYELTLKSVDPRVIFFADSPVRKAGYITIKKFMDIWQKKGSSFMAAPPNAAIVHAKIKVDNNDVAQAIAVELSNPIEIDKTSWKFKMTGLVGKIDTGNFKRVSIIIDDLIWP